MTLDITRLIKMLNMIGSSHDGEALNAARMAHTQLKAAGITWEKLLRGAVAPRPTNQPRHGTPPPPPTGRPWRPGAFGDWTSWGDFDPFDNPDALKAAVKRMQEKIQADLERQRKRGR